MRARHQDGTPAVLRHARGQGSAIYLNMLYFWPEQWHPQFSEYREAYRVFINELLTYAKPLTAGYRLEQYYQQNLYEPHACWKCLATRMCWSSRWERAW